MSEIKLPERLKPEAVDWLFEGIHEVKPNKPTNSKQKKEGQKDQKGGD